VAERQRFGEGAAGSRSGAVCFHQLPVRFGIRSALRRDRFATVCCKFIPRSALESGNVAEARLERVARAIFESRYSIHDLSRCSGEGDENLARFNMPLELGMAMARRFIAGADAHDWMVLVPDGHSYLRFASDLAAFDLARHNGTAEKVIYAVAAWLATRRDASTPITPNGIVAKLPEFQRRRQALNAAWGGFAPWADLVLLATEVAATIQV
jgi:hypothetical protein